MHSIEPYYNWRQYYVASEDRQSPFYQRIYSEFEFSNAIYDHYIHPQWDEFGSKTLYLKILFVNYELHYCIIEFIGEWNDTLYNDIMFLYRNVIEPLLEQGIKYFIMIGENVLEFHSDTNDYYEEWADSLEDGWIIGLNFREHVIHEFKDTNLDYYIAFGGKFDEMPWRKFLPDQLFDVTNRMITKGLKFKMGKKAFNLSVYGKVQGVGFRFYTHKKAVELGIAGFVKNMPDGSVYIEAEGDAQNLMQFLNWCETGPSWARVVKIDKQEVPFSNFGSFNIR